MTSSAPTMRRTRCRRVSECSAVAFQDRASMDRLRTMKMAAAAGNGDEQVRIEGSTAHDPADGNDSFSCESLIFPPSLLRMQLCTEPSPDCVQGSLS